MRRTEMSRPPLPAVALGVALVAVFTVGGCRSPEERPPPGTSQPRARPDVPPISSGAAPAARSLQGSSSVDGAAPPILRCADLVADTRPACPSPDPALSAVVEAASGFTPGGQFCSLNGPLKPNWAVNTSKALATAIRVELAPVPPLERLLVQNAALRLLVCGSSFELSERDRSSLQRSALAVVRRFVVTPEQVDGFHETTLASLRAWLGPTEAWNLRQPPSGHSLHEIGVGMTRSALVIEAPAVWANAGELVAVDGDLKPFVTSVVGSVELRGRSSTASNCVAALDFARVRCESGPGFRIADAAPDSSTGGMEFAPGSTRMQCPTCHAAGKPVTVASATDSLAERAARRARLLDELGQRIATSVAAAAETVQGPNPEKR